MHNDNLKELTLRGMVLGALITVLFTASNVLFRAESGDDLCVFHSCCGDFHGGAEIL